MFCAGIFYTIAMHLVDTLSVITTESEFLSSFLQLRELAGLLLEEKKDTNIVLLIEFKMNYKCNQVNNNSVLKINDKEVVLN